MRNIADIKCPGCKAQITFDVSLGKLKCLYCGNEYDGSELKIDNKKVSKYDNYVCSSCGSSIIADENTSAAFCLYCGNTTLIKNKLVGKFAPSKIIPFSTTKEDAENKFKELVQNKKFVPDNFTDESTIEKITGLYVPYWLYNVTIDCDVEARCGYSKPSGDLYVYDIYKCIRKGHINFQQIPVDGSSKLNNEIMNELEPFNYDELRDFSPAYISGFLAEAYDVDQGNAFKDARERAYSTAKDLVNEEFKKYSFSFKKKEELITKVDKCEYALLPVWILNVSYDGKIYPILINGQTGEIVGDIPVDGGKIFRSCLLSFLIVFTIVLFLHGMIQFTLDDMYNFTFDFERTFRDGLIALLFVGFSIICSFDSKDKPKKQKKEANDYLDKGVTNFDVSTDEFVEETNDYSSTRAQGINKM